MVVGGRKKKKVRWEGVGLAVSVVDWEERASQGQESTCRRRKWVKGWSNGTSLSPSLSAKKGDGGRKEGLATVARVGGRYGGGDEADADATSVCDGGRHDCWSSLVWRKKCLRRRRQQQPIILRHFLALYDISGVRFNHPLHRTTRQKKASASSWRLIRGVVAKMTDTTSPQRRGWRSDAGVEFRQIRTKPMRVIELVNDCRDEKVTKMISYIFSVCLLLDFFQSLFVFFGFFLFVSRTQRKGRINRGILVCFLWFFFFFF